MFAYDKPINHAALLKVMLDCGLNVNDVDFEGGNLLMRAFQRRKRDVCQLLVEHGATFDTLSEAIKTYSLSAA